jgi:antitoxin MazE
MKATIRKRDNSAAVRIPATVLKAAQLALGERVNVSAESGRIVIEHARRKEYDIAELVKGITRANSYKAIDFGKPAGKETASRGGKLTA